MKRGLTIAVALAASGCAALIGASFDDAGLASDASLDGHDGALFPDVSSSDADAEPPFDPRSLPNLGIWLDATYQVDVNGNVVTRWHDRSGLSRDAVPAGGGSNAPILVANALNGQSVVHFTAAQLDLLVTPWAGPGTGEITMFVVSRGYPNSALRFQNSSGTYPFILFPVDQNQTETKPAFVFQVGPVSPSYITVSVPLDGGASIAAASFSSAKGTVDTYTNGLLDEQVFTTLSLPNAVLWIGGVLPLLAAPYTTLPFADGDIAEAIVYTNALGDADRVKVEAYLRAKWGLGS